MAPEELDPCGLDDIPFRELLLFCVVKLVPALVLATLLWFGVVRTVQAVLQVLLAGAAGVVGS